MDPNKLKVLQEVSYRINPCCGLCKHGWFPQNDWGTCEIQKYEHQKHSGPPRQLSIHKYGRCPKFKAKQNTNLGLFQEFFDAPR